MTRLTKITSLAAVVVALGGGTAYAQAPEQTPADDVYQTNGGGVLDVVATSTPTPAPTSTPAPVSDVAPATDEETAPAEEETPAPEQTATPAPAQPTQQVQEADAGSLPFTGFEAGFVALAGAALLGGGVAMRRASRSES